MSLKTRFGLLPGISRALVAAALVSSLTIAAVAQKTPKPEDVVERAIFAYGSRAALYEIQRNGILRGQIRFHTPDGVREGRTTNKFIRKPKLNEDLLLLDLDLPGTRFIIGYDGQKTWTLNNGEAQEPPAETSAAFHAAHEHSYEALLRYKENNARLEYAGTKQFGPNNDLDLIDLISSSGRRTRYEISRRSGRIIYIDYEEKLPEQTDPVKYRLYFKDFRVIQNTLVPYETQVFQNGKLVEERKLVEVAYNVQIDESAFKPETALKPAEASVKP